jgi:hypothetical protein
MLAILAVPSVFDMADAVLAVGSVLLWGYEARPEDLAPEIRD